MGTGGRYRQQRSYGHECKYIGWGYYRISWAVDRYFKGDRLRHPTTYRRDTDEAGARRFCKKWDIPFPEEGI